MFLPPQHNRAQEEDEAVQTAKKPSRRASIGVYMDGAFHEYGDACTTKDDKLTAKLVQVALALGFAMLLD